MGLLVKLLPMIHSRLVVKCFFLDNFAESKLLVWKFELDAIGFFKTKFTDE